MKTLKSSLGCSALLLTVVGLAVGVAQEQAPVPPEAKLATAKPAGEEGLATTAETATAACLKSDSQGDKLSPWAAEILKLAQHGVEESVILSFIDNAGMFNLGAEHVIQLTEQGVSSDVVTAMLQHDADVAAGVRWLTIVSEPAPALVFPPGFMASQTASRQTPKPPARPIVAPSPLAKSESVISVGQASDLRGNQTHDFHPPATQFTKPVRHSAGPKRTVYPVRESQPVELLPPIVFIHAPERPANTLVILGFPPEAE